MLTFSSRVRQKKTASIVGQPPQSVVGAIERLRALLKFPSTHLIMGIPTRLYNIAQTRDDDYRECSTTSFRQK